MFKQFRLKSQKIGYTMIITFKGVQQMRGKRLSFEQLVNENRQELLDDENSINQLELRLEKRHELNSRKQREQHSDLFSNEG